MSVEELKKAVTTLTPAEQTELSAFLFHLRHRSDASYQDAVTSRLADRDPLHWLPPDEFETRLDQK